MLTRRRFLHAATAAGGAAAAAFRDDGMRRLEAAARGRRGQCSGRPGGRRELLARDPAGFHARSDDHQPQQRRLLPEPRVVHEALKRYLDISNQAPVYHMWQILEPNIETVRRRLAAQFGCDPEELAITRNASEALQIAQLGLDLRPGDEVLTTNQDYGRMLDTWEQRVRRDGIKLTKISFPGPAAVARPICRID